MVKDPLILKENEEEKEVNVMKFEMSADYTEELVCRNKFKETVIELKHFLSRETIIEN